jgi:RNA polymerase sigma-70 factor (ECF subfamily)
LRQKARKGLEVDINEMRDVANDTSDESTDELYQDVKYIINANLSDLQREILMMHDMNGLEYADIADQLSMNVDAVRANVSRARNTIRKIYRERAASTNQQKDVRL